MSEKLSYRDYFDGLPLIPPPLGFFEELDRSAGYLQGMIVGALVMGIVCITMVACGAIYELKRQRDALLIELRTHTATHQKN